MSTVVNKPCGWSFHKNWLKKTKSDLANLSLRPNLRWLQPFHTCCKTAKIGLFHPYTRRPGERCAPQSHVVKGHTASPDACHARNNGSRHSRHHVAAHLRGSPDPQAGDQRRRGLLPVGRRAALRCRVFVRLHHRGLPGLGRDHLAAAHDHS